MLNTPVRSVSCHEGKADGVVLKDGRVEPYDFVVSAAAFTDMLCSIDGVANEAKEAARSLRYRNTTLVYLEVDKKDVFSR